MVWYSLIDIVTRLSSLVFFCFFFCHSDSNKTDLLVRNTFPNELSRIFENLACVQKHHLFLDQKNSIWQKLRSIKTLSAQFDEVDHSWRSGVFYNEVSEFLQKINIFNILHNIFVFYCRHSFSRELSLIACVIYSNE